MSEDKFKAAVEEMRLNNGDLVDGLFEMIERLANGNPRMLKKERKMFAAFFLAVIEQMALNTKVTAKLNEIREVIAETSQYKSRAVDLFEQRAELTIQTYKVLRHYLRDNQVDEALAMLNELIENLED